MPDLWIRGGRLILPERNTVLLGDLAVEGSHIAAVGKRGPRASAQELWVDGLYVAPGFLDLHVHGGQGYAFGDDEEEVLSAIVRFHQAHGTTGMLATTVATSVERLRALAQRVAELQDPAILGLHLEGPFIAPKQKGAQNPAFLLPPSLELFERMVAGLEPLVRIVTLAPELAGAHTLIYKIQELGAIPALGHSDATYAEAMAAISAGVRLFTHLGNAMRGLHHREPGAVGAALDSPAFVELICDGVHLHPAFVRLVAKAKGYDRICLVTDAISAAGLGNGEYSLGGLPVLVKEGIARLPDGTLAGSTLTLDRAIRNFREFTGCSLPEAVRCATLNPARLLGIDDRKGSLAPGKDADLVVFDEDLTVHYTIVGGRIVYQRG
ncbi:MAG: N-acetylglucosamine-6-phosphate deacetylase [Candidatus Bipolaricaulota bacterium]|nr:N-acetylglucosamine-6-phosphate deacetylase [Candidatus Bipolaricaulota bacterium]MDW8127432.1 N-acetylglucosamine-6-phosphate deacetylase [Candidatus Bipolaricaulota bacterium]